VGIEAIREAVADDYSVVVVAPTIDLVEQWVRASPSGMCKVWAYSGTLVGPHSRLTTSWSGPCSLHLNPLTRPDGRVLLVADACHRYGAGQWSRVLHDSYRRRLELTTTFERSDDGIDTLLAYFGGPLVYNIGFSAAIAQGVVAHYDVKLSGVELTAAERREYDEAEGACRDVRLKLLAADFPLNRSVRSCMRSKRPPKRTTTRLSPMLLGHSSGPSHDASTS
jgi:RNA polymerase primary sigma factor